MLYFVRGGEPDGSGLYGMQSDEFFLTVSLRKTRVVRGSVVARIRKVMTGLEKRAGILEMFRR